MIIAVDASIPLPVYEQVREQIARMVAAGTLQTGQRLPTIRQLAVDLGLAKGTVAKAYELLESDQVIETRGRMGSFILAPTDSTSNDQAAELAQAAESLVVTARQLGTDLEATLEAVEQAWARF
ncbi:MAG: GntR family transcriptional regulator [Acidimicrobiales bacterium]